jgi:hypothetical protein
MYTHKTHGYTHVQHMCTHCTQHITRVHTRARAHTFALQKHLEKHGIHCVLGGVMPSTAINKTDEVCVQSTHGLANQARLELLRVLTKASAGPDKQPPPPAAARVPDPPRWRHSRQARFFTDTVLGTRFTPETLEETFGTVHTRVHAKVRRRPMGTPGALLFTERSVQI